MMHMIIVVIIQHRISIDVEFCSESCCSQLSYVQRTSTVTTVKLSSISENMFFSLMADYFNMP